jgi:copper ion binding protein
MLQLHGRSIWFKDLNDDRFILMIFDYIDAMVMAGKVLAPSGELAEHVYERYIAPPAGVYDSLVLASAAPVEEENFDGVDPVCMMAVDPASAQWHSEFEGKTYYFCAPSCKRSFDKDPSAYIKPSISAPAQHIELAQVASALVQPSEPALTTDTMTVISPDIDCDQCAKSIQRGLMKVAGVGDVSVDVIAKRVTVRYEAPADHYAITTKLSEIGYPPSKMTSSSSTEGNQIMTKTFVVPNISCDHCVRSIKNEVSELAGVKKVDAATDTKAVTVEWELPATWEQIKAALTEIDYPPQELIQL